jgi:hypothetical protein
VQQEIILGILSGGTAGFFMKLAVDRFFKKNDSDSDVLRNVDKTVAVMAHRLDKLERDINAIGKILRDMRGQH